MKIILFALYLFAEIALSVPLASAIGVFGVFLEIILSAILGFLVVIYMPSAFRGDSLWLVMQKWLSSDVLSRAFIMRIIGAFLLILPGFLGDAAGLVLLAASIVTAKCYKPPLDDDIIDVEVVKDKG
ncbi:MAG: FxsA family protein [Helicobacteraceae bacterium]|jgi:UPF0716 family protein affecting phage T7 exclusion|nr:FxsA family protein [Helicobacteraceae bacterium]